MNVKHTNSFTYKNFNEHPYKYSLYGISSILDDYGIDNKGLRLTNKEDILNAPEPFIAHIGNDFIIVKKVSTHGIEFVYNNNIINLPFDEFLKSFTGIILIAETNNNSIEPNYKENKKKSIFQTVIIASFLASILFLFLNAFINNQIHSNIGLTSLLVVNLIGVYIGYLLILKQLDIHGSYEDKICSLFKYHDCNNILESDASKFFGIIGWSEIGFGYFASNLFIITFLPSLVNWVAIFNIFTLPYSFWSIWYQKYKAKQWCTLCLITLFLLWTIFILNLIFNFIENTPIDFINMLVTISIYGSFILLTNLLLPFLGEGLKATDIKYEINSVKANEDVFKILLEQQPRYEVNKTTSRILFGNIASPLLITIFTNPHCNPCSKMHKRMKEFIKQNNNVCIQYIFSSFDQSLDTSNKFLIGTYQQKNSESKKIYDEWFEVGKYNKEDFFKKYPVETNTVKIIEEFKLHEEWKEKSGLRATPTILVNGYKLPDNYKLEDMRFFD